MQLAHGFDDPKKAPFCESQNFFQTHGRVNVLLAFFPLIVDKTWDKVALRWCTNDPDKWTDFYDALQTLWDLLFELL